MRLDLKLLCMRFSQKKEEPPIPQEGLNKYLLEKILTPALHRTDIYLRDIDFTAFDVEDVNELENYYTSLYHEGQGLEQFVQTVAQTQPVASRIRSFC